MTEVNENEAVFSEQQARHEVETFVDNFRRVSDFLAEECGSFPGEPSSPRWCFYDYGSRIGVLACAAKVAEAGHVFDSTRAKSLSDMVTTMLWSEGFNKKWYPELFEDRSSQIVEYRTRIGKATELYGPLHKPRTGVYSEHC